MNGAFLVKDVYHGGIPIMNRLMERNEPAGVQEVIWGTSGVHWDFGASLRRTSAEAQSRGF